MHGLPHEVPALERQHDPAAEDRIEERKGVAHQHEAGRGTVARVPGILARDPVLPGAFPGREPVLDPEVLLHLAMEDRLRILDAVARQILALRHHPDARHAAVLRDVPEPALVRDVGHGGVAFVDARAALGVLVVGPDRDLVQIGIAHPPAVAVRGEGLLAGAVEGDGRANLVGAARLVRDLDADNAIALHQQAVDRGFLAHLGALFAGIVEQELIELRAQHLPGLGHGFLVVAVEEIERLRAPAVGLDEGDAVFLLKGRGLQLRDHADPLERLKREWDQGFANVIAGEFLALEN